LRVIYIASHLMDRLYFISELNPECWSGIDRVRRQFASLSLQLFIQECSPETTATTLSKSRIALQNQIVSNCKFIHEELLFEKNPLTEVLTNLILLNLLNEFALN
jgi:hypothetical protein